MNDLSTTKRADTSDLRAACVVIVGLAVHLIEHFTAGEDEIPLSSGSLGAYLIILCALLASLPLEYGYKNISDRYKSERSWTTRPGCANGYYAAFLPLMAILSTTPDEVDFPLVEIATALSVQTVQACFFSQTEVNLVIECITNVAGPYLISALIQMDPLPSILLILILNHVLLHLLIRWLPGCFSLGEAMSMSNGILITGISSFASINVTVITDTSSSLSFMFIAGSSCALCLFLLMLSAFQTTPGFYVLLAIIITTFTLPMLQLYLPEQNVFFWLVDFIWQTPSRRFLFIYWLGCTALAMLIVFTSTRKLQEEEQLTKSRKLKVRKYFHVLAMVVFLPGLVLDCEFLAVASTCALVVLVMLEAIRTLAIWPLSSPLQEHFRSLIDERDSGAAIFTHIYLLAGFTIPLWSGVELWSSGTCVHVLLASGALSLGVGDTAASWIGTSIGQRRWRDSEKTMEGTAASIVLQVIFVVILIKLGILCSVELVNFFIPILLTSLLEAFTSQIDNLVLPIFMIFTLSTA